MINKINRREVRLWKDIVRYENSTGAKLTKPEIDKLVLTRTRQEAKNVFNSFGRTKKKQEDRPIIYRSNIK
jgi:hypothetical protein